MLSLLGQKDLMASLNIGVALDEGLASPTDVYSVFYGERSIHWLRVIAKGNVGHGRFATFLTKQLPNIQHPVLQTL